MNNLMFFIEAIMLAMMMSTCVYVTVTDLKSGIIQNKVILSVGVISIILNTLYYAVFSSDYVIDYALNVGAVTFVSIVFYAIHIWSAGDSKLIILLITLIPARLYFSGRTASTTVVVVIIIFTIAYIYTIIETIYLGIKEKNLFERDKISVNIKSIVMQYVKCTCLVMLFDRIISLIFPTFYSANTELIMILNMVLIFISYNLKFLDKWWIVLIMAIPLTFTYIASWSQSPQMNLSVYILVAIVLVLRLFAEKYNYKVIPTSEVKRGMVMSYSTIVQFMPSRIKGLPSSTTEDVRSRINEEEATSIRRWENSKYGKSEIIIVRKVPFAIFISLGTIGYVIARIMLI